MSVRYRRNLFIGALCSSYLVLAGVGYAAETTKAATPKTKKATVSTNESAEYQDGKSIFERSRPDYSLEPARVGSFKVKPVVQVDETYDSNIYAVDANPSDDLITKVNPGISIESDWNRNALALNASGDLGFYSSNSDENYEDYSIGASSRLDILRETFLLGAVSTTHLHEDRGSPDSSSNSKNPTEYDQNNASLTFLRNLHRVSLKLDGDVTQYDFQNGETSSGTIINNNGRDRNEYKATGRVGYEIIPEYEAFVRSTLNKRNYDNDVDASNINRDSDGYEVEGGTALNLGGKTKGEVFAGYMNQSYDSAVLRDVNGVQFGGNILWNATGLTSVKTGIKRGVEETTSSTASGYIATQYSVRVEHELLYNVLAGVNVSYETDDYEGTTISRNDDISAAGAEIKYLMNRNSSLVGSYNFSNRDSNLANQDYNRSLVSVGLKFEM